MAEDYFLAVLEDSFFKEGLPREKARPRIFYGGKYFRSYVDPDPVAAPRVANDVCGEIAGSSLWLCRWRVAWTAYPSFGRLILIC